MGASLKEERYSNRAIQTLRQHNIATQAVGLREGEVSDVQINIGKPAFLEIDTVTLYLNPKRLLQLHNSLKS